MDRNRTETNEKNPSEVEPKARILVIDDEEVVHVSLRRILGRRGHEVETTLAAQEGLDRLANERFDMAITDLMMPEMNGIELLEELKERSISLPVLMITGYPTIKTALQALRLGAVDYLAKPFTRQELLAPVNRALRRKASGRRSSTSVVPPPEDGKDGANDTGVYLELGERYHLRRHSWIVYQQDGTVTVGIEPSFLDSIGTLETIDLPVAEEVVEQGYVGMKIATTVGEEHGVLMPLSGRIVEVNEELVASPSRISSESWLVRLLPDHLQDELTLLVKG